MRVCLILSGFLFFSCSLFAVLVTVDPDVFAAGMDISAVFPYVALSSVGGASGLNGKVYAYSDVLASTGDKVFANNLSVPAQWLNKNIGGYALRADFLIPTDYVAIDFIGDGGFDYGTIDAYNSAGVYLATVLSPVQLNPGQVYTAQIPRAAPDVAYVIAGGLAAISSTVHLDHLVFQIPEPTMSLFLSLGLLLLRSKKK